MPLWRGKDLIERIQPPLINFGDLKNVLTHLQPPENPDSQGNTRQRTVICTEFGQGLHHIANQEGLGERAKLQKLAAEIAGLLSKACLGTSDTEAYYAAAYRCPLTADRAEIGGLYTSTAYPMAVVAKIRDLVSLGRGEHRLEEYCLTVRLLRMAAWLADGDPICTRKNRKIQWQIATHKCGKKACLSLNCIRWRWYEDNLNEAYLHEYERERADPDFKPKRWACWSPLHP